jgi:hypothetical protein
MRKFVLVLICSIILQRTYCQIYPVSNTSSLDTCKYLKDLILSYRYDSLKQKTLYLLSLPEYSQFIETYSNCLANDTSLLITLHKLDTISFIKFYTPNFILSHSYVTDTLNFYKAQDEIVLLVDLLKKVESKIANYYYINNYIKEYVMFLMNNLICNYELNRYEAYLYLICTTELFKNYNKETHKQKLDKMIAAYDTTRIIRGKYSFQLIKKMIKVLGETETKEMTDYICDMLVGFVAIDPSFSLIVDVYLFEQINNYKKEDMYPLEKMKETRIIIKQIQTSPK